MFKILMIMNALNDVQLDTYILQIITNYKLFGDKLDFEA